MPSTKMAACVALARVRATETENHPKKSKEKQNTLPSAVTSSPNIRPEQVEEFSRAGDPAGMLSDETKTSFSGPVHLEAPQGRRETGQGKEDFGSL